MTTNVDIARTAVIADNIFQRMMLEVKQSKQHFAAAEAACGETFIVTAVARIAHMRRIRDPVRLRIDVLRAFGEALDAYMPMALKILEEVDARTAPKGNR